MSIHAALHRPRTALRAARLSARICVVASLFTAGIALIVLARDVQNIEAIVAARVLTTLFGATAFSLPAGNPPGVTFRLNDAWFGMVITPDCSVAPLLGAVALATALTAVLPRISVPRALAAGTASGIVIVAFNQIRLTGLAVAMAYEGRGAFEWWHSLGGSFLMVSGLVIGLGLFFALAFHRGRNGVR